MGNDKNLDLTSNDQGTLLKGCNDRWRNKPALDPYLVILSGPEKGKKVLLISHCTSIGRSVSCNLRLADPKVSRFHAQILLEDSCFSLKDLKSSNGTRVTGTRILLRKLKSGDRIKIGSTELEFNVPFQPGP